MTEQKRIITNDDFNEPFWEDDFNLKHEIINSKYEICKQEDLYVAQAGSLDAGCTLLIEELPKRKVQKVGSYSEVLPYLDKYNKVLIYCKDFNKSSTVAMRFLEYLNGFVIDLDEVRSYNIQIALDKIDRCPVKPNFIVNSGNGLHLYFIFKEKFDFMGYTSGLAWARCVKRVKVHGRKNKRYKITTADKIKDIYSEMLNLFDDPSYKADKLHLAHGIRMFGGKTKNSRITSTIYRGCDERYDLETLADIVGVELFTLYERRILFSSDDIAEDSSTDTEAAHSNERQGEYVQPPSVENPVREDGESLPVSSKPIVVERIDYSALRKKMDEFVEAHKHELMPKRLVPKWKAYRYLVGAIKEYNRVGIRNDCLFIMCCQGKLYQIPENVVRKDLEEMAAYMSGVTPTDPITPDDVEKAFDGYFSYYWYSNEKITKVTGIPFEKKQKEIRADRSEFKGNEVQIILDIIDKEYFLNQNIALRKLSDVLKSNGIKRGKTFLSTDADVLAIRNKYRAVGSN